MPDWDAIAARLIRPAETPLKKGWVRYVARGGAYLNWHRVHQRNLCFYCEVEMVSKPTKSQRFLQPTLDHKVPRSEGGPHTIDNTCCACRGCNRTKGSLSIKEFMKDIDIRSGKAMLEGKFVRLRNQP